MKKIWYSEEYGWVFPGKYWIFGALGVGGLLYFENSFIRIILGIWVFGCIIGLIFGDR
jgi:hypothetical protein